MSVQIDPQVQALAQNVQSLNGEDYRVVESQWYAEEGDAGVLSGLANWANFNNNPAGMKWGNPTVDNIAVGETSKGFLVFKTPADGAKAYATMIKIDPNYPQVRAAIAQKNVSYELQAIAESPWDTGHYAGTTGIDGYNLASSYAAITTTPLQNALGWVTRNNPTAATLAADQAAYQYANGQTLPQQISKVAKNVGAAVNNPGQAVLDSLGVKSWWEVLIIVAGVIIIIVLLIKLFTSSTGVSLVV